MPIVMLIRDSSYMTKIGCLMEAYKVQNRNI